MDQPCTRGRQQRGNEAAGVADHGGRAVDDVGLDGRNATPLCGCCLDAADERQGHGAGDGDA